MLKKIHKLSIILIVFAIFICGYLLYNRLSAIKIDNMNTKKIKSDEVTIASVGDIMVHGEQLKAQKLKDGSYNFDDNFKNIKSIINDADISIGNLETTINPNKEPSAYPNFNSPSELLKAIKDTGFDILSSINNHSLDTGSDGVKSTLKELKKYNIESIGTKYKKEEKNYIIKEVKGIKIGLAAFSYGDIINGEKYLNGIPAMSSSDLLNVMDAKNPKKAFKTIKAEIDLIKAEGAEFITLVLHWGTEYSQKPNDYQKKLAKMLADEGVDLILGSHPHVVQPMEFIKSDSYDKECLVVYSMGNIISNQRIETGLKYSENGIIPIINIKKYNDSVKIVEAKYIPTWVNKYKKDGKENYEIIALNDNIKNISEKYNASKEALYESFKNTTSLISDNKIELDTSK